MKNTHTRTEYCQLIYKLNYLHTSVQVYTINENVYVKIYITQDLETNLIFYVY